MQVKKIQVDANREIAIYDDVFDAKEVIAYYEYAQNSAYRLCRTSTSIIEDRALATLKCDLSLTDMLKLGFHTSKNFKPFIQIAKEKNVRLQRAYINLCSTDDLFPYHVDSPNEKDLTMLYYMNTEWYPMWEGETHFANEKMNDLIASSSFIPGRLAVFNPTIPHKSSQPSKLARQFRFTFANKFVCNEDAGWKYAFRFEDYAIPTDDELTFSERELKAIEFLKPLACPLNHSQSDGFHHLYNTYKLMKSYGLDESLCLAGLFHCIYGTGSYNEAVELNVSRESVREIIGTEAEELVWQYKICFPREQSLVHGRTTMTNELRLKLLWISYANAIEQAYRIEKFATEVLETRAVIDMLI
jgi:hypothetical protein